jgi:hypothetical protein
MYVPVRILFLRYLGIAQSVQRLDDRGVGVRFASGARDISAQRPNRFWGPLRLLASGVPRAFSLEVKRQGREADHLTLSSAEVNTYAAITPLSHVFME